MLEVEGGEEPVMEGVPDSLGVTVAEALVVWVIVLEDEPVELLLGVFVEVIVWLGVGVRSPE